VRSCVTEGLAEYQKTENACNVSDVADQIGYLVNTIGADHVGIGSDYDGIFIKILFYLNH
jgi:microsomal dipeptidase-like Zn-dependent dipeptidase